MIPFRFSVKVVTTFGVTNRLLIRNVLAQVPPWPQSITWYNSEGKIDDETPGSRYKQIADGLGGYALEVKPTEACDQGEWKCVAKSEQGTIAITTCDIKMISKP